MGHARNLSVEFSNTLYKGEKRLAHHDIPGTTRPRLEIWQACFCHGVEICYAKNGVYENRSPRGLQGSWLEIYANLQSPKTPKSISDKVPLANSSHRTPNSGYGPRKETTSVEKPGRVLYLTYLTSTDEYRCSYDDQGSATLK
ncbi:hypothetical protein TNCV_1000071 [Trichonephila clavipes]|nr:hypothetical protein TNCV_1000071 [Trichonephila clavipes]